MAQAVFSNVKGPECTFLWRAIGAALVSVVSVAAYSLKVGPTHPSAACSVNLCMQVSQWELTPSQLALSATNSGSPAEVVSWRPTLHASLQLKSTPPLLHWSPTAIPGFSPAKVCVRCQNA